MEKHLVQRRCVGEKVYWTKEMTPDGNSNTQEQMKRARNDN